MGQAGVGGAFVTERRCLAQTFRDVGPDRPTLAGAWTTTDLAAHVVATEQLAGVPSFVGRVVVARYGWRLNELFRSTYQRDVRRFRRLGFDTAVERLSGDPPRLLRRPSVAPVGLFEVWVHHEDVRRANDLPVRTTDENPDLVPCLRWLLRYQHGLLGFVTLRLELPDGQVLTGSGPGEPVTIRGTPGECLLWLAGRRDVASVELDGSTDAVDRLTCLDIRV